jgi:hypothetical protein
VSVNRRSWLLSQVSVITPNLSARRPPVECRIVHGIAHLFCDTLKTAWLLHATMRNRAKTDARWHAAGNATDRDGFCRVVQLGGFEPPTSGSTIRRSNQLSYNCTHGLAAKRPSPCPALSPGRAWLHARPRATPSDPTALHLHTQGRARTGVLWASHSKSKALDGPPGQEINCP